MLIWNQGIDFVRKLTAFHQNIQTNLKDIIEADILTMNAIA